MIGALIDALWGPLGAALGGLVALVAGIVTVRRSERDRLRKEALEDAQDRVAKGRDHVRDGRDDDPDERVRRNDGQW